MPVWPLQDNNIEFKDTHTKSNSYFLPKKIFLNVGNFYFGCKNKQKHLI